MSDRIDAVLYDFGGVFMASPFEALRLMGEEAGVGYDETLEIIFGEYDQDTDHPWHRAERGELDIQGARDAILEIARARGRDLDLYGMFKYLGNREGVKGLNDAMVESVHRARAAGAVTAIVTNNIAEGRDFWRPLLPLDELFEVVIDSSEVGLRKPDPRIYHLALEQLGDIAPERAVFLDDFEGHVRGAEAVGMIGILVELDSSDAIARLDELLAS